MKTIKDKTEDQKAEAEYQEWLDHADKVEDEKAAAVEDEKEKQFERNFNGHR